MNITLRIKKRYLDEIARGTKTTEFRNCVPFYERRLMKPGISTLTLHYQRKHRLIVEVKKIERISTPEEIQKLAFMTTNEVYAIRMGKVIREIR